MRANSPEPILSFRGMVKRFGGTLAVNNVDLDVYPGEILALLGENGAGKSTLIKMLAGVYAPDSGEITLAGQPYDPGAGDHRVSFIHQDLGLIEWMTVAENIALAQGYPRRSGLIDWRELDEVARTSLAVVAHDIDPQQRVQDLSRTEKSLVAIARALGVQASILVLDEPTASLPEEEVQILFDVLRSLRERGVAMIYVSHRLDEVYVIADRLAVLRDGSLVAAGGHFGPHNLHENRPGSFVSSELIFTTFQNAGIRIFDISDQFRPTEVGAFVPPAPQKLMDHRPNRAKVIQSCDVFVDRDGLVYANDYNDGLYILEFKG